MNDNEPRRLAARKTPTTAFLMLTQCALPAVSPTETVAPAAEPAVPTMPAVPPAPIEPPAPDVVEDALAPSPFPTPKPTPSPEPRPLGPVYYADSSRGWIEVRVPTDDTEAIFAVVQAVGEDGVLWHGDRRTPAEIRELGLLHLVGAGAPTEARAFVALRAVPGMAGASWVLRFRRGKLAGPFLAMSDAPPPDARLRAPEEKRRAKASDPRIRHLRDGLEAPDAEALAEGVARRRVTYEIQTAPGVFPGASTVVAVSAVDRGGDGVDVELFSAVFTVDDAGAVVQRVEAGRGGTQEIRALGDLDGDGFDEVVLREQEYEGVMGRLAHLTPGHVDVEILFSL
ncbi:MAG: hypothetical protein JNK45_09235 [Myxococcales bacterium]|nr:hypothetical protein [Myxococcales bacterium]